VPERCSSCSIAALGSSRLRYGRSSVIAAYDSTTSTDGTITIDPGTDRAELEQQLTALDGVGPWTAAYVALRGLGDPDVFLASDLGVRRALEQLGEPGDPRSAAARADSWRPWRSYALHHLWASLS